MIIEGTSFGEITIDGGRYEHDVLILGKKVLKRSKKRSERIGGHRELARIEIEELIQKTPKVLFIGLGQYGRLPMRVETQQYLEREVKNRKIQLILGNTPDIIQKVNNVLSSKMEVAGLFHVTC